MAPWARCGQPPTGPTRDPHGRMCPDGGPRCTSLGRDPTRVRHPLVPLMVILGLLTAADARAADPLDESTQQLLVEAVGAASDYDLFQARCRSDVSGRQSENLNKVLVNKFRLTLIQVQDKYFPVPSLRLTLAAEFRRNTWRTGLRMRCARGQERVAECHLPGLSNESATFGYAVFDGHAERSGAGRFAVVNLSASF